MTEENIILSFINTPTDSFYAWGVRLLNKTPISVIVPAYNLTDELKFLTKNEKFLTIIDELIIVDDCGNLDDVSNYFNSENCLNKKIKLLKHPRNMGFVKAINTGIINSKSKNDVILLNSDAIINSKTIFNLQLLSRSFANVATVSPLSNSNGFFSIPVNLPDTVQDRYMALNLVNDNLMKNAHQLSEITPVNNGFCLYVTRKIINTIGLFDDHLFYRGYGEETDYCLRAKDAGYLNLLSFNSFGFHDSETSFSGEKKYLQKINGRILRSIHPSFNSDLIFYEKKSSLKIIKNHHINTNILKISKIIITHDNKVPLSIDGDLIFINPLLLDWDLVDFMIYVVIRFLDDNLDLIGFNNLPVELHKLLVRIVEASRSNLTIYNI
jgi:GT2 family glycosyltransferase